MSIQTITGGSQGSQPVSYYDINFANQKIVSSMQMPPLSARGKKDNCHLRGVNLSKNMFSRIYLLHPLQSQQLLILNMTHNLI